MRSEQLTKCSEALQTLRAMLGTHLTGLSPQGIFCIIYHSNAVRLIWMSVFACLRVIFCTVFTFSLSRSYLVMFR